MMYITVKEAAEKWGISDRRVRILCSEGNWVCIAVWNIIFILKKSLFKEQALVSAKG